MRLRVAGSAKNREEKELPSSPASATARSNFETRVESGIGNGHLGGPASRPERERASGRSSGLWAGPGRGSGKASGEDHACAPPPCKAPFTHFWMLFAIREDGRRGVSPGGPELLEFLPASPQEEGSRRGSRNKRATLKVPNSTHYWPRVSVSKETRSKDTTDGLEGLTSPGKACCTLAVFATLFSNTPQFDLPVILKSHIFLRHLLVHSLVALLNLSVGKSLWVPRTMIQQLNPHLAGLGSHVSSSCVPAAPLLS